jgi:hypothetical protein
MLLGLLESIRFYIYSLVTFCNVKLLVSAVDYGSPKILFMFSKRTRYVKRLLL